MALSPRQRQIAELVEAEGRVWVLDLSQRFGATPQTIRKDLEVLAQAHRIVRFHGGAAPLTGVEYLRFESRRAVASAEKAAIGAAAAQRIPGNCTLFVNAGTTTEAAAEALRDHAGLRIVTDNVSLANTLRQFSGVETLIVPGRIRPSDGAVTGEDAVDFIRRFRVDFALIGTAAVGQDGALLDFDMGEARVAEAMIAHARHVMLLADATKWQRHAPVKFGTLSDISTLITDQVGAAERALCAAADVETIETASSASGRRKRA